ncbi:MAG: hypothetical protein Q9196_003107 [Gyalolechia fulgens]
MTSKGELTRLRNHLQSPPREDDIEDVQASINDLSVRTRAQVSAVKQFAVEAGILPQEIEMSTQVPSGSAKPKPDTKGEDSDDEPEFGRVSVPKNPWPEVDRALSMQLWRGWDIVQGKPLHSYIVVSHQYTRGADRAPYPTLLRDLCSRLDSEVSNASPQTYEPEMKHLEQFDVLLSTLQEYGRGRALGYVKLKVPEEAMSTPVDPRLGPEECLVKSYRCRLKLVHKHPIFDISGIFSVVCSKNFHEQTADSSANYKVPAHATLQLAEEGELPSRLKFSQELMLDPTGREKLRTFSFDNEATDLLRVLLCLKDPKLPALKGNILANVFPSTKIHLAANAGVARSLRTSPIAAYSLHYLHRGAPVSWTTIDPRDYPRIAAYIHAAAHTYGTNASDKRPRKPPQCTASVNHHDVYISHKKLAEWDMGWTSFEQRAGELVVLAPFTWAQYYWNETGVMEEGVYGNELWKSQIATTGLVRPCSAFTCGGRLGWDTDLRRL